MKKETRIVVFAAAAVAGLAGAVGMAGTYALGRHHESKARDAGMQNYLIVDLTPRQAELLDDGTLCPRAPASLLESALIDRRLGGRPATDTGPVIVKIKNTANAISDFCHGGQPGASNAPPPRTGATTPRAASARPARRL